MINEQFRVWDPKCFVPDVPVTLRDAGGIGGAGFDFEDTRGLGFCFGPLIPTLFPGTYDFNS